MKKGITKYIVSLSVVAALVVTPVLGAPLSGAELLDRFDAIFAATIIDNVEQFTAEPIADTPDTPETFDDSIIVVIEEATLVDYYTLEYPYDDTGGGLDVYLGETDPSVNELSVLPVPGFSVTSGINRRSESTFDSVRTIIGTAPRGATIRIELYGYNEALASFYKVSGTVLTVGASGNFSSAQQLDLGRNFIRIKATYGDSFAESPYISINTAQLNRLPDEVRNQLERGLLLP